MTDRTRAALDAIDAVNAQDPEILRVDGGPRAKALVHADVVERWLNVLDPSATDLAVLAARAHHLRRWAMPRSEYPEGRAGYLRWRTDHKRRQAAEVGEILTAAGFDDADVERVQTLVAKQGLGVDAGVQTHEDALCLAFLELQLDELANRLGHDRAVVVVAKTTKKMSAAALDLAATVELSPSGSAIVTEAVASVGGQA